ncbi:MAG: GNAT family N-acetyltransferase [Porphyromonadaceae bacterium]|nr:GNAT family N-acetyltransferase [Porphyromonadaceae bacterium]
MEPIRLFVLNEFNYPKFRSQIVQLYLHAFTTGEYAQHIDPQKAESTLDEMVRRGMGVMAFAGDRLAGALLALPLRYDEDFPAGEVADVPPDTTLYISEVMVHVEMRSRGIASAMIGDLFSRAAATHTDAVIRVWDENKPALSLYDKLGFHPVATITQTKKHASGESFEMKKIYLHKKLSISPPA